MSKPNSAQERRKDLESLTKWTKEENVDARSLILLLKEIAMSCMDEGIRSERVNMKSEDGGISTLTERFPSIAVTAIAQIHKIVEDAQKELKGTPPPDPVINIVMTRKRLEDVLKEAGEL